MNELKHCPFCGEKKRIEIRSVERKDRPQCKFVAYVSCLKCFAQISNHGFDWTEKEAIAKAVRAWNHQYTPGADAKSKTP